MGTRRMTGALVARTKYGVVHVDFESRSLRRTPKQSLFFLRDFIESRELGRELRMAAARSAARRGARSVLAGCLVFVLLLTRG